jgi:hypothetical protein
MNESRLPAGARLAAKAEKIEMWAGSVAFYAEVSDAELAELRAEGWDAVRGEGIVVGRAGIVVVHPREARVRLPWPLVLAVLVLMLAVVTVVLEAL